jgi:hypothetical protein
MAHIRGTYPQGIFTPTIDLGRHGGPKNVVEKDIPDANPSIASTFKHHILYITHEAALNVGDSTGGPKKAWGNSRVL